MKAWRRARVMAAAGRLNFGALYGGNPGAPGRKDEAAGGGGVVGFGAPGFAGLAVGGDDEVFEDLTARGSAGWALGVYRDGQMIYAKGYGLANVEESVLITPKTVFDIGSTSKQFTAASILLLEKQGKLSVNDDVRK